MSSPPDSTSEHALDRRPPEIDDVYELSPMQQGMLYDTVASPASGMYCIVVSYRLTGAIDSGALFDAWRMVVARHPVLRTSFHWHEHQQPTQAVHRHVTLPVAEHDWRGLDADMQRARLTAFLEAENRRGFDVTTPPLIRLTLIRCSNETFELVVTHHHLLVDGSCKPLLFAEVFAAYESLRQQQPVDLPPPTPYRLFIEWLRDQDRVAAERFWRGELAGCREATPLWPDTPAPPTRERDRDYEEYGFGLNAEETDRLKRVARTHRLTLNSIVSGVWALLLAYASRRDDVLFGATVNARPPSVDGIDAMMGLFINTLPVRFRIDRDAALADWLRQAQLRQMRAREYDYAPLSSIHAWSETPRATPLFHSIIVFENNAGFGAESERHGNVEVTNVQAHIRNSLPLTLRCVPGRSLSMQLLFETSRFSPATVHEIGVALIHLLRAVAEDATAPVGRLLDELDALERARTLREKDMFQQTVLAKLQRRRRTPAGEHTRES